MADNPDWAKILQFLKEQNGRYRREVTEAEIEAEDFTPPQIAERMLVEDLIKEADLKDNREYIRQVVSDLDNSLNLVHFMKSNNVATLSLEPDGFEVAHERELAKRQERINSALVAFTVVLVLVNIVGNFPSDSQTIANGFLLISMALLIFWTDILDLPSL